MTSKQIKIVGLVVIGIIAVTALGAALLYQRWERGQRDFQAALARSDAGEQAALTIYQRDLPTGTSRADVDKYLASKNISHFTLKGEAPSDGDSYEVSLPNEPGDGLVCDRRNVYVSFEFKMALPSDTLREIRIKKVGHCL